MSDDLRVAYDEDLANRVRELIADENGYSERAMFGGLGCLLDGNMALAASGEGSLMVRVGQEAYEEMLERPHAEPVVMRGRPMGGWIRVSDEGLRTRRQLEPWVSRGVACARSLPPKG